MAALRLSARVGLRRLVVLAWGSLLALTVFFVCLAPVLSNRPPVLLGLVQRILLAFYLAWLGIAALALRTGVSVKRAAT